MSFCGESPLTVRYEPGCETHILRAPRFYLRFKLQFVDLITYTNVGGGAHKNIYAERIIATGRGAQRMDDNCLCP